MQENILCEIFIVNSIWYTQKVNKPILMKVFRGGACGLSDCDYLKAHRQSEERSGLLGFLIYGSRNSYNFFYWLLQSLQQPRLQTEVTRQAGKEARIESRRRECRGAIDWFRSYLIGRTQSFTLPSQFLSSKKLGYKREFSARKWLWW